jgi:hypothetical protein
MDEETALPEDRFQALLGRALRREDRERLTKVRKALGIRSTDAVWDVMIALDHHVQLYSAIPKELAKERETLVAELRAIVGNGNRAEGVTRGRTWHAGGGWTSEALSFCGQSTAAVAFGAICIAAGYSIGARGAPPWGASRPLRAVLGAPAGWLMFILLLPLAARWVRAGWRVARSHEGLRVRLAGWALLTASLAAIVAGLAVLALVLRR